MNEEARWVQRFANFGKAFVRLKAAVEIARQRPLSDLEEQGLIQGFKCTHELAWKTLKDFLEAEGVEDLYASARAVTRIAFRDGLIADGGVWMNMISDRNLTSHTYNEKVARKIAAAILDYYFGEFELFHNKFAQLKKERAQ